MDGPRQLACAALLLIPLAGFAACGTAARPPVTRKEETPKPPSPAAESTPVPPSTEEAPPSSSPKTVDVVDPGGESSPPSLVQAAKAERERRAHAGEPVAVITDKTLPHLPKGQLTYAEPKKKAAVPALPPGTARDEQYWRGRALEIRTRWKKTADEVKDLEQSAAGWRRRFYAENDPYARDSQVKPEWDRVLDRLGKARSEVEATRKELDDFMEEGRQAGALPGWLREGAEQEPARDEKKDKGPGTLEPQEPSIYQQPPPPPENRGAMQ
jgi:hypothetical protein